MRLFYLVVGGALLLIAVGLASLAWGQGPSAPPPSCDEQLNNEMFQKGGIIQQLAVARAQLSAVTKERDELKASLAKFAPKVEPKKEPEKK